MVESILIIVDYTYKLGDNVLNSYKFLVCPQAFYSNDTLLISIIPSQLPLH
jgi:hypothetical protein